MGGLAALDFKEKLHDMTACLAEVDGIGAPATWHQQAALQLVGRGFACPAHLDGLRLEDTGKFAADQKVQTLLQSALPSASKVAQSSRKRLASQLQNDRPAALSASSVADAVKDSKEVLQTIVETSKLLARGPRSTMMMCQGPAHLTLEALASRADELKLCSQQGSGPSVASGLRAWHAFAVSFLEYAPNETLPPRSPQDVLKYIALFASAGTAKNYIGFL